MGSFFVFLIFFHVWSPEKTKKQQKHGESIAYQFIIHFLFSVLPYGSSYCSFCFVRHLYLPHPQKTRQNFVFSFILFLSSFCFMTALYFFFSNNIFSNHKNTILHGKAKRWNPPTKTANRYFSFYMYIFMNYLYRYIF